MGRRKATNNRHHHHHQKSHTLPSSPTHSSSSSDFEFTVSLSPHNKSSSTLFCPADELFYKGQLLPLQLSPRISMVRTLLLASSSTSSSSDTTTTASRDSTASTSSTSSSSSTTDLLLFGPECDSSRPSSVTEDDEYRRLHNPFLSGQGHNGNFASQMKKSKYFSLSKFSSVFRKEGKTRDPAFGSGSGSKSVKRMSASAKEVIRKYLKKVKPLYEKLSQKQQQQQQQEQNDKVSNVVVSTVLKTERSLPGVKSITRKENESNGNGSGNGAFSLSFSGNLRYPRRKNYISSCPSSMRSSPSHSGALSRTGLPTQTRAMSMYYCSNTSSMEELQSAIQGAIAHCKNSMVENNKPSTSTSTTSVSNEI